MERHRGAGPGRSLRWRAADAGEAGDVTLLAELNRALIVDEGHSNPMSLDELADRMRGWLTSEYRAVLFLRGEETVAYALYRDDEPAAGGRFSGVHLRQFFVAAAHRRRGMGRAAWSCLREEVWPAGVRVSLETLSANERARAFWTALGLQEYAVTYETREASGTAT